MPEELALSGHRHWDVKAIALAQIGVGIYVYLFNLESRLGQFQLPARIVAEPAARTRVERDAGHPDIQYDSHARACLPVWLGSSSCGLVGLQRSSGPPSGQVQR